MPWLPRALAFTALAAIVSFAAGSSHAQTAPAVVFNAPAGDRPAGPVSSGEPFSRILPSGRLLHPTGIDVVVGMNALGVTLTPDGRYAIVSNDDEREATATSAFDGLTVGGYSLCVVSTATMRVVSRYRAPHETFFVGLAALRDVAHPGGTLLFAAGGASDAVYAFDIDAAGQIAPDALHTIAIPAATDPRLANAGHAFPSTLVPTANGARLYVVNNLGNNVVAIDTASRTVVGMPASAGYFPLAAALTPNGLLVANEGLMEYGKLATPVTAPPFAAPAAAIDRSSSLSLLAQAADGTLASVPAAAVPMDRPPDGIRQVGGRAPGGDRDDAEEVVRFHRDEHGRPYRDRCARTAAARGRRDGVASLRSRPRTVRSPMPSRSAATNAVCTSHSPASTRSRCSIRTNPLHPHRIGLIATGWFPSALALSRDGRYLYVTNAKGFGEDRGFTGGGASPVDARGHSETVALDSNAIWSTLERIDLKTIDLHHSTPLALSYLRTLARAQPNRIVPQERLGVASTAIKHVVVLLEENKTYDAMLGDLTDAAGAPYGAGRSIIRRFRCERYAESTRTRAHVRTRR